MPVKKAKPIQSKSYDEVDPFAIRRDGSALETDSLIHVLRPGIVCDTERRGHKMPQGKSIEKIVLDSSDGFIPLWTKNTTLRWRFRERSFLHFASPIQAKAAVRKLLAQSVLSWGTASPVKFKEDDDLWDFEVVMRKQDDCDNTGCTLATAFFPDGGRHQLYLYPLMLKQTHKEQVDTLVHEVGHIFGLRHFFALVEEKEFPSEVFGKHSKFSIMNYGSLSKLTAADKTDLKNLYKQVWSGKLAEINGTKIKLVKCYSSGAAAVDGAFALAAVGT
jgi:hypothetical protein